VHSRLGDGPEQALTELARSSSHLPAGHAEVLRTCKRTGLTWHAYELFRKVLQVCLSARLLTCSPCHTPAVHGNSFEFPPVLKLFWRSLSRDIACDRCPQVLVVQEESLMWPLVEVEMPLVHVLQRMEAVGIAVDVAIFEKHRVHLLIYAKLRTHADTCLSSDSMAIGHL
jgi:hypothetical protein